MAYILVIDDDASIRALLREILKDAGHQVEVAEDGQEGVRKYSKNRPDLVITDVLMPEKDGVELILELTESDPDVKIIAMSGGGRGLDAPFNLRIARDFGALRVLSKPFVMADVLAAVNAVLKGA